MAEGGQAFEDLVDMAEQLGQFGMGPEWMKSIQGRLKASKQYLKADYKVCIFSSLQASSYL